MKTETKYNLLIWGIVILAVMNISTVLTVVYHRQDSKAEVLSDNPEKILPEDESLRYSGRYFRDQLGLTRSQMAEFTTFNYNFRQQVRDINNNLNSYRIKMLDEMSASQSNVSRLDMLSDSIGLLHSNLKKLTYKYYFDLKNICDDQQKVKLEQMFMGVFDSGAQQGQFRHGRGGGAGGWGRNRRIND
jgi:hypothetical protein